MRILHVISTVSARYGGPSSVVRALACEQARQGHAVTVCTTNLDCDAEEQASLENFAERSGFEVQIHCVDFRPIVWSRGLARAISCSLTAFDVVHVHGLYRFPPTFAATLARRRGVPYLIRPHGALDPFLYGRSRVSVPLKRIYERLFDLPNLNGAQALHFTSSAELDRTAFLQLKAPGIVIPNGLDWRAYQDLPAPGNFRRSINVHADQPLILFLGRLNFKKGLDLLVPAFARVRREIPNAVLAIVGPDLDGLKPQVETWCAESGLNEGVIFRDFICPEETKQAYVDADVFALTSYSENFGMTVVEALACRCPVVISDEVNIWRDVKHAGAGIVVPTQVRPISEALKDLLLTSPTARARMGDAGRGLVERDFNWTSLVRRLDQVYSAVGRKESSVDADSVGG
jgi:glycosyltransferase involved in cell wall biosynthesis